MICSFCFFYWVFVVSWYGFGGCFKRHRWDICGKTVYAGPIRIFWGPK